MKKVAFILFFLFSLTLAKTQNSVTVNGISLSEVKTEYIEITGSSKVFTGKAKIVVDYGQAIDPKDSQIKDKYGNLVVLNSMVDALNLFTKNGFEISQTYGLQAGNQAISKCIMRRRKPDSKN